MSNSQLFLGAGDLGSQLAKAREINGLGAIEKADTGLRTIRIRFPLPDNVTNRRSGASSWQAKGRELRKFRKALYLRQLVGALPPSPDRPLAKVLVSSTMKLGGAMDDDNAVARHKPLLDWLKQKDVGFIIDDRRKYLRWKSFPRQIVQRDGDYWIELTLEEVSRFPGDSE
jgi:hypothetical protein